MSYQTTESKKEEFRKYLENSGVIDQLTKILVGLYEEPDKPNNPSEFIKNFLGQNNDLDVNKLQIDHDNLRDENELLKQRIKELEEELESLKPSEE